jgi:hypothetical protein
MTSAALVDLRNRIATNTLTTLQQAALTTALDAIDPTFPSPDDSSSADAPPDTTLAREWIAALYSIQATAGGIVPVPPTTLTTVANLAALAALSTVSLADGSEAYVQTVGAYFTLESLSALAPDGITIIAAAGGGNWLRTYSAITEQALAQAVWFVDPAAGNDEATGLTSLVPLKHVAEIYRRWATTLPQLAQATTINWLSSGPATDPWVALPTFVNGGSLRLQGVPIVTQTTTIGVFTAAVRGGANTLATITSPGVPSWAALVGQLIHDTTHPATFYVHADAGAGVAQITNPLTTPLAPGSLNSPPVTLVNGDTIQLLQCPTVFASEIGSPSGSVTCNQLVLKATTGQIFTRGAQLSECDTTGQIVREASLLGSTWASCLMGFTYGVVIANGGRLSAFGVFATGINPSQLDGDVIVNGNVNFQEGLVWMRSVYINGTATFVNQTGACAMQTQGSATYGPGGRSLVWGPGTVNVANGAQFDASNGGTAVQKFVNTGGLQLDGVAAGSTYTVATGVWSAGTVALSPTSLDADGALINPKTNSRIHV